MEEKVGRSPSLQQVMEDLPAHREASEEAAGARADSGGERQLRLFVGLDSTGEFDLEEPLVCVATFLIRHPMDLDSYTDGEGFEVVRVRDDRGLFRWAATQFDHYEIRAL